MKVAGFRYAIGTAIALAALCPVSIGQVEQRQTIILPAQDIKLALRAVAQRMGYQLVADPQSLRGMRSGPLNGSFTVREAVDQLLAGSGLVAEINGQTVIVRGRAEPPRDESAAATLVVTGSHIRGAKSASQVISISQDQMRDAGQSNLGDVVRSIPQSFSGGQNPGVGFGAPGEVNYNVNSASSINLRGLGPDATLTLLNGRRLAYNAAAQSVDVSAIPLGAVDRIEVVADGASALYGSDAVGGVANIILKRDFDGLLTSARWGGATDGGYGQQQYGATIGRRWASGGVILAYEYSKSDPILAGTRSYADTAYRTNTLLPELAQHNVLLSGHQRLASGVEFNIDGLYSRRKSETRYGILATGDFRSYGGQYLASSDAFALAPSLVFDLPADWTGTIAATYGKDRSRYSTNIFSNDILASQTKGCYCNRAVTSEASAEGALITLPAGDLRLAIGGGYRNNQLRAYRTVGAAQNIRSKLESYFGYGEAYIPLVSPAMAVPFVYSLNVSAAMRYENYPGVDSLGTPKLGIIYALSPDLEIKGSWGKSFKAPTLYQRFANRFADIYPTTALGSVAFPTGSTALVRTGGNPDLRAERATSWSATIALHPRAVQGLRIEASYFDINYRGRIAQPLSFRARALSDPAYADLINYSPSESDKLEALTGVRIYNNLPIPYDPSTVVAIFEARYLNVAGQKVHGFDMDARYSFALDDAEVDAGVTASYLRSRQQLSAGQSWTDLAGTIFNPPHWRGRGNLTWRDGGLTVATYFSYIGGVADRRSTTALQLGAMTSADITLRYAIDKGPLDGTELSFSVQNAFNDKPSVIPVSVAYLTPYDSTNYSPVGRFLAVSISRKW